MKQILAALLPTLLVTAAFAQNIVVVDMEAVLAKHPNTPAHKKVLESTLADYTKERDALRQALDAKRADFEKQVQAAQNPMLAPAKADELKRACQAAYEQLEREGRAAEERMAERSRTLSEMERKLIDSTVEEIQAQIQAYAKERGYDLVLYKEAVAFARPEQDITDRVIVLCGGTPEKKEKKATVKEAKELKAPARMK